MTFGETVRLLRLQWNLKQSDLAKAINTTSGTISKWERGLRIPEMRTIDTLCEFFCVSRGKLLGNQPGTDRPETMQDMFNALPVHMQKLIEGMIRAAYRIHVEEIQDMVINELDRGGWHRLARHYSEYRLRHELLRKQNSTDRKILALLRHDSEVAKQENANKDPMINSTMRDYLASEVSEDICRRYIFPADVIHAHDEGICMDVARLSPCEWKNIAEYASNMRKTVTIRQEERCKCEILQMKETLRVGVLYALGYLYEHREEADHAEGEASPFYADGIVYYRTMTNNGYSGDLEIALIPEWFRKSILKEILDANGVLIERSDDVEPVYFALLFEFDGDKKAIRHVLYNCTVSTRPTMESQTKEDSIEPGMETLTISTDPREDGIVKAKTGDDTTSETYQNWYQAVYLPGQAAVEKAKLSALTIGSLTLTPEFDDATVAYTTSTSETSDTITATGASGAEVSIKVNGTAHTSGEAATWANGNNTVTVTVSKTGLASQTYVVTVTKAAG